VVIISGVGFALWKNTAGTPEVAFDRTIPPQDTALQVASTTQTQEQDSDNDGLADWEEVLWKTDPHNPDTDGDGTQDGAETIAKRDPTIPGPDDTLRSADELSLQLDHSSQGGQESQTPGEQTISNILNDYLAAQQSGTLTDERKKEIANSALEALQKQLPKPKEYVLDDITISTDTTPDALKRYGNMLGEMFTVFSAKYPQNEFAIIKNIATTKNMSQVPLIVQKKVGFGDLVQNLLAMSVPRSVAEIHLAFINGFSGIYTAMDNMSKIASDPVRSAQGLKEYQNYSQKILLAGSDLAKQFKIASVTFANDEYGHFFLQYAK